MYYNRTAKEKIHADIILPRVQCINSVRGGSRISHWGAPTLIGGGTHLQHWRFLVKTYVKTKEFGPVGWGGGRRKLLYVDPPLSVYIRYL